MEITQFVLPTAAHFQAANCIDCLRWLGPKGERQGVVRDPLVNACSVAMVKLTNPDIDPNDVLRLMLRLIENLSNPTIVVEP